MSRAMVFALCSLVASAALGQEMDEAPLEESGGEVEGIEVVDPEDQGRVTPDSGGRIMAPGEVHTVERGDTLWDLSQRYLGNPWYWPKVWSYNPEIANPHWIYPGNRVKFFPSGEEGPTQVEVGTGPSEEDSESSDETGREEEGVRVSGKIGYTPKATSRFTTIGFVTGKELDEAGKIEGSFAESQLLSYPDKVYLSFRRDGDVRVGGRYVIYKTLDEVRHPINGSRVGYLTKFLGAVKVIALGEKVVTGIITDTWDEITRGDLIGPFGEQLIRSITTRPNEKQVKGYIVAAMVPHLTYVGEHHLVIIDRGSADGVQPGNTFTVVRQGGDELKDFMNPAIPAGNNPYEDIASCVAVDVKDKATTCLMTRSIREVVPGDKVIMRVPAVESPQAALR